MPRKHGSRHEFVKGSQGGTTAEQIPSMQLENAKGMFANSDVEALNTPLETLSARQRPQRGKHLRKRTQREEICYLWEEGSRDGGKRAVESALVKQQDKNGRERRPTAVNFHDTVASLLPFATGQCHRVKVQHIRSLLLSPLCGLSATASVGKVVEPGSSR